MKNLILALCCLSFLSAAASPQNAGWSKDSVELFATLPVQDGGRVKPMDKLAGLNLLTFNGKRKLKLEDRTIHSAEWLMDCLFLPERAKDYEHFWVRNDAVLTLIGVDAAGAGKRKSDRYSYNQLLSARMKLEQEASRVARIEPGERSTTQGQTLKLATDIREFESLIGTLAPLRTTFDASGSEKLLALYGSTEVQLFDVLLHAQELGQLAQDQENTDSAEFSTLQTFFSRIETGIGSGHASIAFMPPPTGTDDDATWWSITDLVMGSFQPELNTTRQTQLLGKWLVLDQSKGDPAAFHASLESLHADALGQAEARGEYDTIALEVQLERMDPFTNALVLYLLGFLLLAFGWLAPKGKWLPRLALVPIVVGLGLAVTGIVMRCIIRSRPPVVSLYDTVIFITSVCVLVGLISEYLTRARVALVVSALLGVGGMFLAGRYELKEITSSGDTMASVVAVLDTNYYLAIHVTTISMGYAGGLLAAALAHVWLICKLLRVRENDKAFYKGILRMTYGVLCFSLLFAIFGTIMGGVWANDSWGRFWGWDPKENGALLICLWELLILHSRMGGYVRDRGFAVMVVLGGVVVSFSWWGVNLLGIGMHSYGFTSGVAMYLGGFWLLETLMVGLSGLDFFIRRADAKPA